jgi:hypothetical protein
MQPGEGENLPDTQLYLAVGVPVVMNVAMLTLAVMLLGQRISDMGQRINDLAKLFAERLRRVEEVLDARLKHVEEKLGIP